MTERLEYTTSEENRAEALAEGLAEIEDREDWFHAVVTGPIPEEEERSVPGWRGDDEAEPPC